MKLATFITAAAMLASSAAIAQGGGNNNGPTFGGNTTNINTAGAAASASAKASASSAAIASASQRQGQEQAQGQLQGQSQSITGNNSSVSIRDRKQAPSSFAPSMSSGHPCAIAPASVGISFIGGSVAAGGMRSDDACMLAQLGYTEAAMVMIAGRSAAARDALERTGYIATVPEATTSSRSIAETRPQARPVAYTSCKMQDGAIRVGVRRGASETARAAAVSQCRASLQ